MNINGETTIFRNTIKTKDGEVATFSTTISAKDAEGHYSNMYCDVKFAGVEQEKLKKRFEEKVAYKISITDGFLSFRNYQDKNKIEHQRVVLVVKDFKPVSK